MTTKTNITKVKASLAQMSINDAELVTHMVYYLVDQIEKLNATLNEINKKIKGE